MKQILCAIAVLVPMLLTAQDSGKIIYETTIDLHRRMTGEREQFKDFVPQYRKVKAELIFGNGQALFKNMKPSEEEIAEQATQGRRMRFAMRHADDVVWVDYENHRRVEQREFMDKKFLISGEPHVYPWKLTGETKQVGQYLCQQATFQDSIDKVDRLVYTQCTCTTGPGPVRTIAGTNLACRHQQR